MKFRPKSIIITLSDSFTGKDISCILFPYDPITCLNKGYSQVFRNFKGMSNILKQSGLLKGTLKRRVTILRHK